MPDLVSEVLLGDLDHLHLGTVPVPLERHLVLRQLLEDEQQQLIVVFLEGEVARERLQTDHSHVDPSRRHSMCRPQS